MTQLSHAQANERQFQFTLCQKPSLRHDDDLNAHHINVIHVTSVVTLFIFGYI